jgi:hypothetical protein
MSQLVQLKKSVHVKKVIEIVLMTGNYINGGTKKGGAYAFTIETLNQLRTSKSTANPKVSSSRPFVWGLMCLCEWRVYESAFPRLCIFIDVCTFAS